MTYWIVLGACAVASYTDVRDYRIPNWLTIGLAIVVLALSLRQGPVGFGVSFAIFGTVLLIGAVAFCLKMLGGGDMKLAAAAAAGIGYPDFVSFLVYTLLAGGVLGIIVAAIRRRLREKIPYAIAITAGVVAIGASHTVAPLLRNIP